MFRANEIICNEFNTPGSAVIFPSFINHKVNKITSGKRNTLAIWLSGPKKFIGNKQVGEVQVNKMILGSADSSGRRKPEIQENSEYNIKADIVIKSLGFDPENLPELFSAKELSVSRWGTIKIDLNTMQTNIDGIFAAGDIVRGASLVVWAIKDGRDAAIQIQKYLKEKIIEKDRVKAA